EGEPTRPAQVRAAGQVHRAGTSLGDVSGSGGGAGRGRRRGGVVVSSGVGGRDVVVGLVVGLGDRGPDGLDLRETAGGDLRGRAARLRLPAELRVDQGFDLGVGAVVHDDDPVRTTGLLGHHVEAAFQQVNAVVGDDHGCDGAARV